MFSLTFSALAPVREPLLRQLNRPGRSLLRFLGKALKSQKDVLEPPLWGEQHAISPILPVNPDFIDVATEVPRRIQAEVGNLIHPSNNLGGVRARKIVDELLHRFVAGFSLVESPLSAVFGFVGHS